MRSEKQCMPELVSGSGEEQNRSKNQYENGAERMTNQW
jgi:hypothetical protein